MIFHPHQVLAAGAAGPRPRLPRQWPPHRHTAARSRRREGGCAADAALAPCSRTPARCAPCGTLRACGCDCRVGRAAARPRCGARAAWAAPRPRRWAPAPDALEREALRSGSASEACAAHVARACRLRGPACARCWSAAAHAAEGFACRRAARVARALVFAPRGVTTPHSRSGVSRRCSLASQS